MTDLDEMPSIDKIENLQRRIMDLQSGQRIDEAKSAAYEKLLETEARLRAKAEEALAQAKEELEYAKRLRTRDIEKVVNAIKIIMGVDVHSESWGVVLEWVNALQGEPVKILADSFDVVDADGDPIDLALFEASEQVGVRTMTDEEKKAMSGESND